VYFSPLTQEDLEAQGLHVVLPEGFRLQAFGFGCGHSPYPGGWYAFLTRDGEISTTTPRGTGTTLQAAIDNARHLIAQKANILKQFGAAREADARRAAEVKSISLADLGL
jgi:hypothetical protein